MARNKEALLLLVDVSPAMHNILPEVEKFCRFFVQKKLIYNKSDEVGVVVFGTEETYNELEKEIGGYEHVVVLRSLNVVDEGAMSILGKIPRGLVAGDFLDAIVVGMDMLIKKFGPTNKGKQRLCLITSAQYPVKKPYEGTKEEQIDVISTQMKAHGMKLDCIVFRKEELTAADKMITAENDILLERFSRKTVAKITYVDNPTSLLGAVRTKSVSPTTIFRGDLEISPMMSIKVWVYKKVSEERFPTLKKYSDKAPPSDKFATHEVKVDFEYVMAEEPSKTVPPEQRIKGFRYGPQVVPISPAELELLKFKPEKGVKLLGFTDASNIMRHYYMKETYVFISEPRNENAMRAVSALSIAMERTKRVAILRCVWKQGQANVVIGVLTPNVSSALNVPDFFYFNVLPFAEDVREFRFPSFSNLPPSKQPTEKQLDAADKLVRMLDLPSSEKKEMLCPDLTPNPALLRFYAALELKSEQPDADIPPIDHTLKRIVEPELDLLSVNDGVIASLVNQFELKDNLQVKKRRIQRLKDKSSLSNEDIQDGNDLSDIQSTVSFQNPMIEKVEKIGKLTPVQDFQAMLSRRDGHEFVSTALEQMKMLILGFFNDGLDSNTSEKAVECLSALRAGCVIEQEPNEFNRFMQHLSSSFRGQNFKNFWEKFLAKNITLITKKEAIDSEVAEDEANSFLLKSEPMCYLSSAGADLTDMKGGLL